MRMLHFILVLASLWGCLAQPGIEEENKGEKTNNLPIKHMRDAQDYAYRARGEATEARASSHEARARIAARRTMEANGDVKVSHGINSGYLAPVKAQTKQTDASAKVAISFQQKTRAVVDQTDALAYNAAYASASAKVAELKAGAAAYFQELLASFRAKAAGPKDAKFAAASEAAKPYIALQLQTLGVVETYFIFCKDLMAKCKALVKTGFIMAGEANVLQAQGNSEMALRKMIQAHGLIDKANLDEGLAKNVYKLAREINVAIPAFTQTAEVAAAHAYAMTLLQDYRDENGLGDSETPKRNPFATKKVQPGKMAIDRSAEQQQIEQFAHKPSDQQLLQLQKTGDEIEEAMKSFSIENDKLAKELDKFSLKAEADTEKSLAEAQKVAEFLSHKVSSAEKGKTMVHATIPAPAHVMHHHH